MPAYILGVLQGEFVNGKRQSDQVGVEVEVQPSQHWNDGGPQVVVGPPRLFPVPFVEHLGEELG